jgi:hypothetical protein
MTRQRCDSTPSLNFKKIVLNSLSDEDSLHLLFGVVVVAVVVVVVEAVVGEAVVGEAVVGAAVAGAGVTLIMLIIHVGTHPFQGAYQLYTLCLLP